MEKIKAQIGRIVDLNAQEWTTLFEYLKCKHLKKNDYLLKEGQVCDSIAYVNSGALIYFKLLENGREATTDFAFENEWVADNFSRLNKSLSMINIKAIKDSELVVVKHDDLDEIFSRTPKLEKLGRVLLEQAFIKITQHSIDLQTLTAKEQYIRLLEKYPEIFEKTPLYHIANYLGIDPKSLSRIRNEISRDK